MEDAVPKDNLWRFAHVYVASRVSLTFREVEAAHADDPAFTSFRVRCGYRVSGILAALEREQDGRGAGRRSRSTQIRFSPDDQVREFCACPIGNSSHRTRH